jgi:flagellar basal-body rod modification protein FlgD
VQGVSDLTQATATQGGGFVPAGSSALGQEDFLQLLVTQLQAQDPLNPQDSTEFTAQLAQFSSLEQLMNVNAMLNQLAAFEAAMANTQAANLIGQEVKALGNQISVQGGDASQAGFELNTHADTVKVTIRDEAGAVIDVIEMTNINSGEHAIEWDGLTGAGTQAADGAYTFSVEAESGGESISAESYIRGRVEGVDFNTNGTFLVVGDRHISLGDVISIREAVEVTES